MHYPLALGAIPWVHWAIPWALGVTPWSQGLHPGLRDYLAGIGTTALVLRALVGLSAKLSSSCSGITVLLERGPVRLGHGKEKKKMIFSIFLETNHTFSV